MFRKVVLLSTIPHLLFAVGGTTKTAGATNVTTRGLVNLSSSLTIRDLTAESVQDPPFYIAPKLAFCVDCQSCSDTKCLQQCEKCPDYVQLLAGRKVTVEAPEIVLKGDTTIEGGLHGGNADFYGVVSAYEVNAKYLTASGHSSLASVTINGELDGIDANFSGTITASEIDTVVLLARGDTFLASTTLSGPLDGTDAAFSGTVDASKVETVSLSATGDATLPTTTLTGDLHGINADFNGALSATEVNTLVLNAGETFLADTTLTGKLDAIDATFAGTVKATELDTVILKSTGEAALFQATITGDLHGAAADFSAALEANEITTDIAYTEEVNTIDARVTGDTVLAKTFVTGKLTGGDATFSDVRMNTVEAVYKLTSTGETTLGKTSLTDTTITGDLHAQKADFTRIIASDSIVARAVGANDVNTGTLRVTGSTTLYDLTLYGDLHGTNADYSGTVSANTFTSVQMITQFLLETGTASLNDVTIQGYLDVEGDYITTYTAGNTKMTANTFSFTATESLTDFTDVVTNGVTSMKLEGDVTKYKAKLYQSLDSDFWTSINGVARVSITSLLKISFNVGARQELFPLQPSTMVITGGLVSVLGKLTVTGDVTITAKVGITGDTNIEGILGVTGDTNIKGIVSVTGDTNIKGLLTVTGDTNLKGGLQTTGASNFAGEVTTEGDLNVGGILSVEGEANFAGAMSIEGDVNLVGSFQVEGDVALLGAFVALDIAVGYIEATGCFECTPLRRRRQLAAGDSNSNSTVTKPAAGMYAKVGKGDAEDLGLTGAYWRMTNPIFIEPYDVDEGLSSADSSSRSKDPVLVVDGHVRFYGGVQVLPTAVVEDDLPYLSLGAAPPADFEETIQPASLLIDGDSGGRMYASTSADVSPINTAVAVCEIPSGATQGSVTVELTSQYAFCMVGGYTSSSSSSSSGGNSKTPPPNALYAKQGDGPMQFVLHCEAFEAPFAGDSYRYTANLVFFHSILANTAAF